ncbi:hypothetical protein ACLMJK_001895 [Lecanora helva]
MTSNAEIPVIADIDDEIVEPCAEEKSWLAERGIEEENDLAQVDITAVTDHAERTSDRTTSPILSENSASLAEELSRVFNREEDDTIDNATESEDSPLPESGEQMTGNIDESQTCDRPGSNSVEDLTLTELSTAITDGKNGTEISSRIPAILVDEVQDLDFPGCKKNCGPAEHSSGMSVNGTLGFLHPERGTHGDDFDEHDQRLSRLEKWQRSLKLNSLASQESSNFQDISTVMEKTKFNPEPHLVEPEKAFERAFSQNPGMIEDDQAQHRMNDVQAPEPEVKRAHVESNQHLPRRMGAPKNVQNIERALTSPSENSTQLAERSPPRLAPGNPQRMDQASHAPFLSSPQCLNSSTFPCDEGILTEVLESCIQESNSLLARGSSRRALARSREIGSLVESILTDVLHPSKASEDQQSLSDLIDNSAWRAV